MIDLDDVAPADRAKVEAAQGRFRVEAVTDPDGPAFDAAYAMLDSFFGARGELEPREGLRGFVRDPALVYGEGVGGHYHLLVAWDGDTLAGVRDCYVDIDQAAGVCLVALSHAYVAPAYRRSGLAALFRAVPVSLARARVGDTLPIVVVAEMEPLDPGDFDTRVRLVAYGRSGFSVLDPARVPYSQPDFRDDAGPDHTAIALLGVVRWVGHERDVAMPIVLAAAFPRLFHVCHRMYLPVERVDPSEVHALRALSRVSDPVPLLPLPQSFEERACLAPLMRSAVLACYPRSLRGPDGALGDPAEELARV